jgi:hypothetical protein
VKPMTVAKLTLAGTGLALFFLGLRFDNLIFRWTAIGLVAVAWMLRFLKDTNPGE